MLASRRVCDNKELKFHKINDEQRISNTYWLNEARISTEVPKSEQKALSESGNKEEEAPGDGNSKILKARVIWRLEIFRSMISAFRIRLHNLIKLTSCFHDFSIQHLI